MSRPVMPPQPPLERPYRLELAFLPGARDARGQGVVARARRDLDLSLREVETRDLYLLDCRLEAAELEQVARAFEDPIVQHGWIGAAPARPFQWLVEVGFKPGVTDNVGTSARVAVADVLGRPLEEDEQIHTATCYLLRGPLRRAQVDRLATGLLANPLIHSIRVGSYRQWRARAVPTAAPRVDTTRAPQVGTFDLAVSDERLIAMSRHHLWALSLEELHAIRRHFEHPDIIAGRRRHGLGTRPTDVEMETLAQTWSEHCKHKIFNSRVAYEDTVTGERQVIDGLFKTCIRGATDQVSRRVDWLLSVFSDNAGVVRFTDRLNLVYKVETHNTPSALDPYGGAITGIVGVNRDPFGTGRGAELLVNTWGYCFATPFYQGEIPEGLMHPRRIRDGVHQGVIDGGNQSGIPYGRGWELFDDRYLGKPLVYCGTVGIMPARLPDGTPSEQKHVQSGDVIVMTGGRIGADGIHGATFSSQELHEESPSQAVQIGDPITQKKMTDFLLEARDAGLYSGLTDNGAGGLSSSVGEMALHTGGARLDLEQAPLKYPGLQPWEILLSEAQERMTVAVPPDRLQAFLDLARRREVEATPLGAFTDTGSFEVRYRGRTVALLALDFLHDGWPEPHLPARWEPPPVRPLPRLEIEARQAVAELLVGVELASLESKARQYDHEVKGRTIVKPFGGVESDVPVDATVFLVAYGEPEGVVLAEGINPWQSDIDTHGMALAVVDEAVRRAVAAGARPGTISALDNFCWPDPVLSEATPDGPYKMAQLVRACRGLYEACVGFGVPLISGKDSMKNDSTRGGVKISIPPTLLVSVMGRIDDVSTALTPEPKAAGDLLYLLGETRQELGASAFARWAEAFTGTPGDGAVGGALPLVDPKRFARRYERLHQAHQASLLQSARATGRGGLATTLALMGFGSEGGLHINLDDLPIPPHTEPAPDLWGRLFSESAGRVVLTVRPEDASRLEQVLADEPLAHLGEVTTAARLVVAAAGETVIDADLLAWKQAWQATLAPFA